jgi:diguanylate cyclase (GGDEF)-like protein/PAS domain S-box-containing protein
MNANQRPALNADTPATRCSLPLSSKKRTVKFRQLLPALWVPAMHLDVTQRELADAALAALAKESERRERIQAVALASISDFVYLFDRDGRFLFANQRLLDRWQLPLERVIGRTFQDLDYPEELAERLLAQIARVFADGQNTISEIVRPDAAGAAHYYESIFSPVLCDDGSVEFVVGVTRDVTERRLATDAVARSQKQLQGVIDGLGPSMFVALLSPEGILLEVNKAPLIAAGLNPEDVLGMPFVDTHWWSSSAEARDLLREAIVRANRGESSRYDVRTLGADGKHIDIDFSLQPLFDEDGSVSYLVPSASVITERTAAQEALLTSAQGLVYLNRVYAMLSSINSLIVRARSRDELFKEACRIAVEVGGFRGAMVGILDQGRIRFAAVSANAEVEEDAAHKMLEESQGRPTAMAAEAIESQLPSVSNDSQNDPKVAFREAHRAFGVRSLAILPLIVAGETTGTLSLYASEIDFFHDQEIALLTQLTGDVAFAMKHIDKQDRLEYLAYYDTLTGLANRSLFIERAAQCLRSSAGAGQGAAMVLIDLERFKSINDSLGQAVGDELLKQVGAWLGANLADATLLARIGSDQFAIMLCEVQSPVDAVHRLENLIASFHEHAFLLQGEVFRIAAKFGVAMFPQDGDEAPGLFKKAESALKHAKAGGNRQLFYTQKMTESVARKLSLENQLRHALDNEEFVLHYQPKVNLLSGGLTGAEALIRWNDPRTGLVPPGQFIPILEETGLIFEVGRWALRQALADYLRWHHAGLPAVRIAVNVSPLQLRNAGLVDEIGRLLAVDEEAAGGLELEITESMIMGDIEQSITSLKQLRAMGISIAIDDFGTGFSSLGYLSRLPIDTLKIDLSFVREMNESPEGLSLVSTIITLARSLRLKVVAEGVETTEQANMLRLLRCDEMQGYFFSKPVPGEIFEERFLRLPPM